jgi:ribonuclease HI
MDFIFRIQNHYFEKRVEQWHIENRKPFRNKDLIWEAAELACHDEIEWEDLVI